MTLTDGAQSERSMLTMIRYTDNKCQHGGGLLLMKGTQTWCTVTGHDNNSRPTDNEMKLSGKVPVQSLSYWYIQLIEAYSATRDLRKCIGHISIEVYTVLISIVNCWRMHYIYMPDKFFILKIWWIIYTVQSLFRYTLHISTADKNLMHSLR